MRLCTTSYYKLDDFVQATPYSNKPLHFFHVSVRTFFFFCLFKSAIDKPPNF